MGARGRAVADGPTGERGGPPQPQTASVPALHTQHTCLLFLDHDSRIEVDIRGEHKCCRIIKVEGEEGVLRV